MLISIQLNNYVFLLECLFTEIAKRTRNNILEKHYYIAVCIYCIYVFNFSLFYGGLIKLNLNQLNSVQFSHIIVFTESTRHGKSNTTRK